MLRYPNGSDSLQDLTSNKIYHLFSNRCFRNYEHFERISKDAKFVQGGEPYPSLGEFANLRRRDRGTALPPSMRNLDKIHMDILYGDSKSKLGFRFALLLVGRATKYIWVYDLNNLLSSDMTGAREQF